MSGQDMANRWKNFSHKLVLLYIILAYSIVA